MTTSSKVRYLHVLSAKSLSFYGSDAGIFKEACETPALDNYGGRVALYGPKTPAEAVKIEKRTINRGHARYL